MKEYLLPLLFVSYSVTFAQTIQPDSTQFKQINPSPIHPLDSKDFNQGMINSPYQLFNGRLTGLGMTTLGSDPNGEYTLHVRGFSTIQSDSKPLLVVDGFIVNDLLLLDANDVEQVTLLKDAASASIYGVQGGNGVLLITTKKRKTETLSVNFNTTSAIEQPMVGTKPATAEEYKSLPRAVDYGSSQDWLSLITRTGLSTANSLSISGGSKDFSIHTSVNYRNTAGTLKGTGFNQLNTRINLEQKAFKDKLVLRAGFAATSRNADYGFRDAIKYAFIANPTMPVFDPTSIWGGYRQVAVFGNFNPVATIEQNINTGKEASFSANISGQYKFQGILTGLGLQSSYQQQTQEYTTGTYISKFSYYPSYQPSRGLAARSYQEQKRQQFSSTLSYEKKLKSFEYQISSGYHHQDYFQSNFNLQGGNFLTDAFTYNNLGSAQDFQNGLGTVGSSADSYKTISWVTTASVLFKNRYFLNATSSYSGSTRLGVNNKWGCFPSIGGGIQWSEGLPLFNSLKVRASWGKVGNQPQQSGLSTSVFEPSGRFFYNGNYDNFSFYPIRNSNPNLQWEEKTEFTYGADFTLLNNKVKGSIDWFSNSVTNWITPVYVPTPPSLSGVSIVNLGELQNNGFELYLSVAAVSNEKIKWETQLNLSTISTEVKSLRRNGYSLGDGNQLIFGSLSDSPGSSALGINILKEGAPLGQIYGLTSEGADAQGRDKIKDINGDGRIGDSDDSGSIGSGLPSSFLGWGNRISFKKLEFSFLLRGAFGHQKINAYRVFQGGNYAIGYSNLIKTSLYDPNLINQTFSSRYVENAGFVKLDNIALTYHIPSINKLTITLVAQNLFTITSYTGIDPDVAYNSTPLKGETNYNPNISPWFAGLDKRGNYLPSRIFSIGVAVKL
jgi:iron complex outermembrane receptor protein